ncbi:hypothetical protein N7G274_002861 [Stereocaulon virgatum]|uniref:Zinc finger PHD-type domain-containing protein n=1 Tax=Stereocaulon virgatum TaxID=373712 RepID=A0ABR4AF63_9LECA
MTHASNIIINTCRRQQNPPLSTASASFPIHILTAPSTGQAAHKVTAIFQHCTWFNNNNVHPTNHIEVFLSISTVKSAFAATQASLTLSTESTGTMPTIRPQSGGNGLTSQGQVNNNGGNDITDDDADFLCGCGTADPGKWIECSKRSCAVRWYHFKCVGLKEAPLGSWFCAHCSPTAIVDRRTRTPEKTPSNTPVFPNVGRGTSALPTNRISVKKGVAIKKVAPKKEKSRWKGWVEVSETEEEESKQAVEESWAARILTQQRRSYMREVHEDPEAQDAIGSDEESWSTRIMPQRRRSSVRIKAVNAKPQKEAEVIQEAGNRSETDEEPLSTKMLARQGRSRAKLGARVFQPDGEDDEVSDSTGATRSENNFFVSTQNRPRQTFSSVKPVTEHVQMQNRDETEGRGREEVEYDADQSAYDETDDEVEMLSPESNEDDIVHEQSVSGDDTETEFEGFSDDENTMDYTSGLDEQDLTAVESLTGPEDISDDEFLMGDACDQTRYVSMTDENHRTGVSDQASNFGTRLSQRNTGQNHRMDAETISTSQYISDSANFLLSAAGVSVQRHSLPNSMFRAPTSDFGTDAS